MACNRWHLNINSAVKVLCSWCGHEGLTRIDLELHDEQTLHILCMDCRQPLMDIQAVKGFSDGYRHTNKQPHSPYRQHLVQGIGKLVIR